MVAGRASISSAFFATKIALSRPESQIYFPKNKSIVTGNPLMTNILNIKTKTVLGKPPVILVIGGSRGSSFINELVMNVAKSILSRNILIHITGERDFEKVEKFKEKLSPILRINYKVYPSINPLEIGNYYSRADLVISRSGANSISEILYAKRPAILIPLPRTFLGEQVKNARYAESLGFSYVFFEKEATSEAIIKEINRILTDWRSIVDKTRKNINPDMNAARKVVDLVEGCI